MTRTDNSATKATPTEAVFTCGVGTTAEAPAVQPILLRLEGTHATPTTLKRLHNRVDAFNAELAEEDVPFRVRLLRR